MNDDAKLAAAVLALALVAAVRVELAQRHFSATHDEPAHIACGYEWLTGTYVLDPSHPPLARAIGALPLWLDAETRAPQQGGDLIARANELLYRRGDYVASLAAARRGTLLLFAIAIAGVAMWARMHLSRVEAFLAAALFTTLPPILGHAGLVTTDMAVVAAMVWALVALEAFLRRPDALRGALLGAALAFGLLAKFSFVVYFPAAAIVVLLLRRPLRVSLRGIAAAALVAFVAVWAGYRFQFASASATIGDAAWVFHKLFVPEPLAQRLAGTPLPAPSLPIGLAMVRAHNQSESNLSFLLGEHGGPWWEYFPVVLFYKTPIPFLILLVWGAGVLARRRQLLFPLVTLIILAVSMTSRINIGVRHVLPVYAPAAIVAAAAVTEIWRRSTATFSRLALAALLLWLFAGVAASHPDYLPWFNEAAGAEPWRIAVDSNLEWGQDGLRLARAVRERGIDRLQILYATNIRLDAHGVNAERLTFGPKRGWIAIGEAPLSLFHKPEMYGWLHTYRPVARIGKSMRLYYIP